jgi:hypothetical protein
LNLKWLLFFLASEVDFECNLYRYATCACADLENPGSSGGGGGGMFSAKPGWALW